MKTAEDDQNLRSVKCHVSHVNQKLKNKSNFQKVKKTGSSNGKDNGFLKTSMIVISLSSVANAEFNV